MFKKLKDRYFSGLTSNTFFLAAASFFADVSTEMLYPVLPIYLTQYMNASGGIIGIIEGIAQATQNIIQGFSGYFSDKLQRRKPIALFGFCLSAVSKPFIGVAQSWQMVLVARFHDRLGSGIRSAPRDALIASSVDAKHKGKAFGLEGFGDNLGAFLGPLITVLLFFFLEINIRYIFYLAIIPGLLAVAMVLLVKESPVKVSEKKIIKISLRQLPKAYWSYIVVIILFSLGNSSNLFLILQVRESGLSLPWTVCIYALFNLIAALVSYPAGSISDKYGRRPVLLISFCVFLIAYSGFATGPDIFTASLLFLLYGLFQGMFRTVGKSIATDLVPENLRASGIGWYSTAVGISSLFASVIAGQLWDKISHASVFIFGTIFSGIGIISLLVLMPVSKKNR